MGFVIAFNFQWGLKEPSDLNGSRRGLQRSMCFERAFDFLCVLASHLRFFGEGGEKLLPTLGGGGLPRARQPERGGIPGATTPRGRKFLKNSPKSTPPPDGKTILNRWTSPQRLQGIKKWGGPEAHLKCTVLTLLDKFSKAR